MHKVAAARLQDSLAREGLPPVGTIWHDKRYRECWQETKAYLSVDVWMISAFRVVLFSRSGIQRAFADNRLDAACVLWSKVGDGKSCVGQTSRTVLALQSN